MFPGAFYTVQILNQYVISPTIQKKNNTYKSGKSSILYIKVKCLWKCWGEIIINKPFHSPYSESIFPISNYNHEPYSSELNS